MDSRKRAGKAKRAVSRGALLKQGVPLDEVKAVAAEKRCMKRLQVVKGPTPEEQERKKADNAAMAEAARKRALALREEQQACKRDLAAALRRQECFVAGK